MQNEATKITTAVKALEERIHARRIVLSKSDKVLFGKLITSNTDIDLTNPDNLETVFDYLLSIGYLGGI